MAVHTLPLLLLTQPAAAGARAGAPQLPFPDPRKWLPDPMPPLGRASRALFTFEAGWTNLNHGSYGAPPAAVQEVQRAWSRVMEANPETFIRWTHYGAIDAVRAKLAAYVGAAPEDVVLIDNASHGMNAVLRSLAERLGVGAVVLDLNLAYEMVRNTLGYCEQVFGQRVVTANVTADAGGRLMDDDAIVGAVGALLEAHGGAVKLVTVSHITSCPAVVMPVARLAALAHAHGALIVADGAHALGQISPLAIPALGVDFYVANGHKWLPSPKGSGLLWVARQHQHLVYPTTISQEGVSSTRSRFAVDFSYQGTDDPTAWLSMAAALDVRAAMPGGEPAVVAYANGLSAAGGALLARMWGTQTLLPAGPTRRRGFMVNVRLPTANGTAALAVGDALLARYRTWVPSFSGAAFGAPATYWCRVSAFVYNDLDDFEMLGKAVLEILA